MLQNQSQSRESVRLEGTHQTWGPTVDVPVINGIWDTSVEPEPELPKQTRAEHRKNIPEWPQGIEVGNQATSLLHRIAQKSVWWYVRADFSYLGTNVLWKHFGNLCAFVQHCDKNDALALQPLSLSLFFSLSTFKSTRYRSYPPVKYIVDNHMIFQYLTEQAYEQVQKRNSIQTRVISTCERVV